jgi:serine/threonine protein kinase
MLLGSQDHILLGDFDDTIVRPDTAETLKSGDERTRELAYMAPELFEGKAGLASDQYALGVVVYEWLIGDLPFRRSRQSKMEQSQLTPILLQTKMPEVPSELAQVIGRALMKDPQQRFADVNAFASALVPLLLPKPSPDEILPGEDGSSTSSPSSTGLARLFNQNRTRSGATRAIGISLILIVVLLTGGVFLFSQQRAGVSSIQVTQTAMARSTQQGIATFTAHSDQDIYTITTRGNPSINDPLNTKSKGTWQTFQVKSDGCTFSDKAYILRNSQAKTYLNCKSRVSIL